MISSYGYVDGGYGANSTTPLVASISQKGISFAYTYDSRGNITSETRTDASGNSLTTNYLYDALGQLVRVNDPHENATWAYEYDRGGNITKRLQYAYTTADTLGDPVATHTYGYNSQWKDQLTANGSYPLTYDAIGNLKTHGGWEYEWVAGRQLVKQTQNEKVVSYDYDYNGMRIRQTVSNKTSGYVYATYNYIYSGSKLIHMSVYNDDLHFFYDNQGRPAKVKYNGEMYTYLHNLQGDIVGIVDGSGALVVEYKYNAWGTLLSRTGSMASSLGYRNPFRYRGYIYDEETWMYWLKSRYYYPELHRFINADVLLGIRGMMLTHNAYSYCWNNPTMHNDPTGNLPSVDDVKLTYSFLGGLFLSLKGYEISKACYQHFLLGNGEPLDNGLLKKIGNAVSTSKVFKERILNNAPSDKKIWIDRPADAIEMSGDLFYAIQHITPVSVCIRTPKAIVGISYFSDCYDFKYRSEEEEKDFFKRTVNNDCGYALQENGYGTNYMINVLFPFYIPLE